MSDKRIYIFKISNGYKRCTVWHGWPSGEKIGTSIIEPNKELIRRERYDVIAEWLVERFDLQCPVYVPTANEPATIAASGEGDDDSSKRNS